MSQFLSHLFSTCATYTICQALTCHVSLRHSPVHFFRHATTAVSTCYSSRVSRIDYRPLLSFATPKPSSFKLLFSGSSSPPRPHMPTHLSWARWIQCWLWLIVFYWQSALFLLHVVHQVRHQVHHHRISPPSSSINEPQCISMTYCTMTYHADIPCGIMTYHDASSCFLYFYVHSVT